MVIYFDVAFNIESCSPVFEDGSLADLIVCTT